MDESVAPLRRKFSREGCHATQNTCLYGFEVKNGIYVYVCTCVLQFFSVHLSSICPVFTYNPYEGIQRKKAWKVRTSPSQRRASETLRKAVQPLEQGDIGRREVTLKKLRISL